MKLALLSDQSSPSIDKVTKRALSLTEKDSPTVGYISSAPDRKRVFYENRLNYYSEFGAKLGGYTDLEDGYTSECIKSVFDCDAIHLTGGNTYRFNHWMKKRNIYPMILEYLGNGGVLIGVSAGAILMTPDIDVSKLCGDDDSLYSEDCSGGDLTRFLFIPHASGIADLVERMKEYSVFHGLPVYAIDDNQGIISIDGNLEIFGGAHYWHRGEYRQLGENQSL